MLKLSLSALDREPVWLRERVPMDHPLWHDAGIALSAPLDVDLQATSVGEGVLVRGKIETETEAGCRRCLEKVSVRIADEIDILYEPLSDEDAEDLEGEVYPMPDRGDELDLSDAIREQLIVRMPDYVVCSEECQGLCPHCGIDLNQGSCDCTPETSGSPWDALKQLKFD